MENLQQGQIDNTEMQKQLSEKEFKRSAKIISLDKAQPKTSVKLFLEEATEIYNWLIKE